MRALILCLLFVPHGTFSCDTIGWTNHNPTNLSTGIRPWKSAIGVDAWKHLQFKDDETGLRMAYKVLKTYRTRYHIHTIEHLCGRWVSLNASWQEKQSWIRTVMKRTRTKPGQKLDFSNPAMAEEIVRGIVYAENSCDDLDPAIYARVFQ